MLNGKEVSTKFCNNLPEALKYVALFCCQVYHLSGFLRLKSHKNIYRADYI